MFFCRQYIHSLSFGTFPGLPARRGPPGLVPYILSELSMALVNITRPCRENTSYRSPSKSLQSVETLKLPSCSFLRIYTLKTYVFPVAVVNIVGSPRVLSLRQQTMQSASIIVSLLFASSAPAHPLNTTILFPTNSMTNVTLPAGATNHGDPGLICTPATWFTVASFILANYFAHAATTQLFPGETLYEKVLAFFTSLLFPASGVFRGLNSIARGIMVVASYRESELRQATVAGALCMVIRTQEWSPAPPPGLRVHGVTPPGFVNKHY